MEFIDIIKTKAKQNKKRIVLSETSDKRMLEAAMNISHQEIAEILLVGNEEEIKASAPEFDLSKVRYVNQEQYDRMEEMSDFLYELRKEKGMTKEEARELLSKNKIYFGTMLVKMGQADGMVAGAVTSTADVLRAALQIIKTKQGVKLVSACFIMEVPNCTYGENGMFIFADTALNPNPTAEELVEIAASSVQTFTQLIGDEARVAMLSFSTKGSGKHSDVTKMEEATKLLKEKYKEIKADGTLQLDAALDAAVAKIKAPDSEVAGSANVLIFPDLDAGNIGYKLVERLAKANAYGPFTQGLALPVNDLSRGCSAKDIEGTIAITAVQAGGV